MSPTASSMLCNLQAAEKRLPPALQNCPHAKLQRNRHVFLSCKANDGSSLLQSMFLQLRKSKLQAALQLTQGWPCRSLKHLQGGGDPVRGLWNQLQRVKKLQQEIIIVVLCSMSHNAGKLQ